MLLGRGQGGARTRRGNGVRTAGVPRVAATEPTQRQPAAADGTMPLQRLDGIGRARGVEAAPGPEERGDEQLVEPDGQHEHAGDHRPATCSSVLGRGGEPSRPMAWTRARSRAAARLAEDAAAAGGKARTTTRLPPGRWSSLAVITWRSRRSTRFRTTAGPTARDTTKPTRGGPARSPSSPAGERSRWTASSPDRPRWPPRRVAVNSARWRSRAVAGSTSLRPRAGCGPWCAERRGSSDRHACACAGESRGSWPGDGCSVGRCACSLGGSWHLVLRALRTSVNSTSETRCSHIVLRA
jgi:hypothetical protein